MQGVLYLNLGALVLAITYFKLNSYPSDKGQKTQAGLRLRARLQLLPGGSVRPWPSAGAPLCGWATLRALGGGPGGQGLLITSWACHPLAVSF